MSDIFLSADNTLTHQLFITPVGSNKQRNYDLSTVTELRLEFFADKNLLKVLSSLSHTGLQIQDPAKGIVSYQPETTDFDDVFEINRINSMRWRVINPINPNGLLFGRPALPVRIFR